MTLGAFQGFIPDLISKVARKLRQPFAIKLVNPGQGGYGVDTGGGEWNGMVGEVARGVSCSSSFASFLPFCIIKTIIIMISREQKSGFVIMNMVTDASVPVFTGTLHNRRWH